MIDIHSHILPNLDDGSESLEQSLKLIDLAVKDGVTDLFLTPHLRDYYETRKDKILSAFNDFKREIGNRNIPINLYLGQEVQTVEKYKRLFDKNLVIPMNDTEFLLIEFYFRRQIDMVDIVNELGEIGYKCIVAHFERYATSTLEQALEIKSAGGFIQVNASSILGSNGFRCKRLAKKLFERGLVDFVASDSHYNRKYRMKKAFERVKKKFGDDVADAVFNQNAKILIKG